MNQTRVLAKFESAIMSTYSRLNRDAPAFWSTNEIVYDKLGVVNGNLYVQLSVNYLTTETT